MGATRVEGTEEEEATGATDEERSDAISRKSFSSHILTSFMILFVHCRY